jgi:hypothetical protein
MRGVALPSITEKFDVSIFPQTSTMDDSASNEKTPLASEAPPPSYPPAPKHTPGPNDISSKANTNNGGIPPTTTDPAQKSIKVNTPERFARLTVESLSMTATTSDFTRSLNASAKHWKGVPVFRYNQTVSTSLHFSNVKIPYFKDKAGNYGAPSGYVTASFDPFIKKGLEQLLKGQLGSVEMDEPRIISTPREWWKNISLSPESIGTLDASTQFTPVSVSNLLKTTQKGFVISGEFKVVAKYKTEDGSEYRHGDKVIIALELIRGFISAIKQDIANPQREVTTRGTKVALPQLSDVTSDSVLGELAALRI